MIRNIQKHLFYINWKITRIQLFHSSRPCNLSQKFIGLCNKEWYCCLNYRSSPQKLKYKKGRPSAPVKKDNLNVLPTMRFGGMRSVQVRSRLHYSLHLLRSVLSFLLSLNLISLHQSTVWGIVYRQEDSTAVNAVADNQGRENWMEQRKEGEEVHNRGIYGIIIWTVAGGVQEQRPTRRPLKSYPGWARKSRRKEWDDESNWDISIGINLPGRLLCGRRLLLLKGSGECTNRGMNDCWGKDLFEGGNLGKECSDLLTIWSDKKERGK